MKHAIGAFAFIVVLIVLGWLVLRPDALLPAQASAQAIPIDQLFNLHFKTIAILFGLIMGLMLYSIVFFRRKPGDTEDGAYIKNNTGLEVVWSVIPLGVVLAFAFEGAKTLAETERIDPQPLEVVVTAQQWAWHFEYPAYNITTTDLVLPVNQQVLLRLTSMDVIHSFWVPEFRVKQDAVPGEEHQLRITPNKKGAYTLVCAEICGTRHAYMIAKVMVETSASFSQWVSQEQAAGSIDPVERGKFLYTRYGCDSCHSLDGSRVVGPTFLGIYDQKVQFEDGSDTTVDEAYMKESILDPGKKIVKGFTNAMPADIGSNLTDAQIDDLIAFIKTIK